MIAVNGTNLTGFSDIPAQANIVTGGWFWTAMLFMMWIVLLILLIAYGFEIALMSSSFLGLILSLMLLYANLIAENWVWLFAGLSFFSFIYLVWSSKPPNQ